MSQHIESLIFSSEHPISPKEIKSVLENAHETKLKLKKIVETVDELKQRYTDELYSFELTEIDGAYQFLSKAAYFDSVASYLKHTTKKRLSKPALETLAIIAYKQPITKIEAEKIRGVSCDYAVQKLLEKELVEIIGRSDAPGRPLLYATTAKFMDYFGLKDISELPKLKDFNSTENTVGELAPIEETVSIADLADADETDGAEPNSDSNDNSDLMIDEEGNIQGQRSDESADNRMDHGPNVEIIEHVDPEAFIIEDGLMNQDENLNEHLKATPDETEDLSKILNDPELLSESENLSEILNDPELLDENENLSEQEDLNQNEGEQLNQNKNSHQSENENEGLDQNENPQQDESENGNEQLGNESLNVENEPEVNPIVTSEKEEEPTIEEDEHNADPIIPSTPESEDSFTVIPNQRLDNQEEE